MSPLIRQSYLTSIVSSVPRSWTCMATCAFHRGKKLSALGNGVVREIPCRQKGSTPAIECHPTLPITASSPCSCRKRYCTAATMQIPLECPSSPGLAGASLAAFSHVQRERKAAWTGAACCADIFPDVSIAERLPAQNRNTTPPIIATIGTTSAERNTLHCMSGSGHALHTRWYM